MQKGEQIKGIRRNEPCKLDPPPFFSIITMEVGSWVNYAWGECAKEAGPPPASYLLFMCCWWWWLLSLSVGVKAPVSNSNLTCPLFPTSILGCQTKSSDISSSIDSHLISHQPVSRPPYLLSHFHYGLWLSPRTSECE